MKYASLFRRSYALFVDSLILLPFSMLSFWAMASLRGAELAVLFPIALVAPAYHIWFHARSGQTVGKRVANIRVVAVSGQRISLREAVLRSAVDVIISIPVVVALYLTVFHFTEADLSLGLVERAQLIEERGPVWGRYARYAANAWYWSELVFILFNAKRRALHDFIAGTVVVYEPVAQLASEGSGLGPARVGAE
jgi:uncharacterized RDD family membrane protein YckC